MRSLLNTIFIKIGLWFGNLVVHWLEKIIPSLKDKEQNLYGFTGYLEKFNLTNKENFKRSFKAGIVGSVSLAFWLYLTLLFTSLLTNTSWIFNINVHILLLKATLIAFLVLLLICPLITYKLSYKE